MKKEIETSLSELSYKNRSSSDPKSFSLPIEGVFSSLMSGFVGFGIVFFLVLLSKLLSYTIGANQFFNIESQDIIISSWGFLIFSFSVFVKKNNIRRNF